MADFITTGTLNAALVAVENLNASNITVGTLQGIRAILESGSVGGWEINSRSIYKTVEGTGPDGNPTVYTVTLRTPLSDVTQVLSSSYQVSQYISSQAFYIQTNGNAFFRKVTAEEIFNGANGLDINSPSVRIKSNVKLYGYLHLGQEVNGTKTDYGSIYMPTDHELYLRIASDLNRSAKLSYTGGHWGFHPYADTYLDLGLSGNRWDNIYAQNGTIQTSDRKQKKGIKPLTKKALDFIMSLKPVSFLMRKGTSGRRHWGLIAQDVEESMDALGITPDEFAGFVKDEEGRYGLRYEEFIAPLVYAVQDLTKRVQKLEGKQ